jgi:hypothetical protein
MHKKTTSIGIVKTTSGRLIMNKVIKIPESTRRVFLLRSVQALGALTATSVISTPVFAMAKAGMPQPPFNSAELTVFRAITDAIIPQSGAFKLGALDVNLAELINKHLTYADQDMLTGLKGAFAFVEHESPKMINKPTAKFSQLSTAERTKILETMATIEGVAVQVFAGLKSLSLFFFYSTEQSWAEIGHLPPLVKR